VIKIHNCEDESMNRISNPVAASCVYLAIFLTMIWTEAASADRDILLGTIISSGAQASPLRVAQGNPSGATVGTPPSVPVRTQGKETNPEGSAGYATGTQSPGTQQGNNASRNANTKAGGNHK
jgi:hypothetical protein